MSAQPLEPVAAPPPVLPMLRAMVGVGLLCGLLISSAFLVTRPAIERNRAEALQKAIFQVLPEARASQTFTWSPPQGFEPLAEDAKAQGPVVHVGYDEHNAVAGLAIEAAGMGYQDVIRVLYGVAPARSAIVGMRVLESRETPGLGDRIETDAAFQANFEALDVSLEQDGHTIANPIVATKQGAKVHPWQIDGITGATISSKAIANILRRSSETWIPRIAAHTGDFERRHATDGE